MPILEMEGLPAGGVPLPDDWHSWTNEAQQAHVDKLEQFYKLKPGPQAPDEYRGSVLPIRRTAQGDIRPGWGLAGTVADKAYDALVRLPTDIGSGAQQIMSPTGGYDPRLIDRTIDAAQTLALSPSPAGIAGRASMMPTPSTMALKKGGGAEMDALRDSGFTMDGRAVGNATLGWRQQLIADSLTPELAPQAHSILKTMPTYGPVSFGDLAAKRTALGDIAASAKSAPQDIKAAMQGIKAIDGVLDNLQQSQVIGGNLTAQEVSNRWREARGNIASSMRSNAITGEADPHISGIAERAQLTADSTYSGRNLDNALRRRVAAFITDRQNVLGYTPEEISALEAVAKGSETQNQARLFANRLGGGGGIGQLKSGGGLGGMAGAGAMYMTGDPAIAAGVGTGVAGASMVVGSALKKLENLLARNSIDKVATQLRQRSPMYENRLPLQDAASSATGVGGMNLGARDAAILRTLAPGLLDPRAPLVRDVDPAATWAPGQRLPPGYI